MIVRYTILISLISLVGIEGYTQNQNGSIRNNFQRGEYALCITECDLILKRTKNEPNANFFKGASLVRLKKYTEAGPYLKRADENGYASKMGIDVHNMLMFAGLKQTDQLFATIDKAAASGFASIVLFSNEEFEYLKNNADFIQHVNKVDANANPCKYGSEFKRLDFWLGEWDIYSNGALMATSIIKKSEDGCSLYEDYKTSGGFTGRSTNYYDPTDSKHTQIWIDKFNNITIYKEVESRDGFLRMAADKPNGVKVRMTYELDSKNSEIVQTIERSQDGGGTWTSNFVGVYKRK